jgi:hypothetical protein
VEQQRKNGCREHYHPLQMDGLQTKNLSQYSKQFRLTKGEQNSVPVNL